MRTRFVSDLGGCQFHHVVSRVVDRRVIFGDFEKAYFREWLGNYADFCGMRVITFCLMGNHFHALVAFSKEEASRFAEEATDDEIVGRARAIYTPASADVLTRQLSAGRKGGDASEADEIRAQLLARMGDLSVFVQELKRRFTRWYNARNDRVGTLWESRFRSVLVEGDRAALETVAAYIDLNPVRAGMVDDPQAYRFCGYAEALGEGATSGASARMGIATAVGLREEAERNERGWWENAQQRYRLLLFGRAARTGIVAGAKLEDVVAAEGQISRAEALRCRTRYFSEGGVIGSRAFLEKIFLKEKAEGKFSAGRTSGARPMRGADWEGLATMRDLQGE